jgi:hypothetical protein
MTAFAHMSTAVVHIQVWDYYSVLANGSVVSAVCYMLCFFLPLHLVLVFIIVSLAFSVFGLVTWMWNFFLHFPFIVFLWCCGGGA